MEYLAYHDRFAYRFRCLASPAGQKHFEVQIARMKETKGFQVVMGYRYIDDIIEEQKKQKIRIEVRTASYVIRKLYKKWKP